MASFIHPSINQRSELVASAERALRNPTSAPRDDAGLLADAGLLFRVRVGAVQAEGSAEARRLRRLATSLRRAFHASVTAAPQTHLSRSSQSAGLTQVERELVFALCLRALGLADNRFSGRVDVSELQSALGLQGRSALRVPTALQPGARLLRSGIVHVESGDLPVDDEVRIDPGFLEPLLGKGGSRDKAWQVRTQQQLFDRTECLVGALAERSELIEAKQHGRYTDAQLESQNRVVRREMRGLETALLRHPKWGLARIRGSRLSLAEFQMLLVLLGRELGLRQDGVLTTGAGLARCASTAVSDYRHVLCHLMPGKPLRREGLVRPASSEVGEMESDDMANLPDMSFELTKQVLEDLGLKRKRTLSAQLRSPVVSLDSLVLPPAVQEALGLVLAQARHGDRLFDEWGLGKTISYGRGNTALFAGPPGVGKTATAEAIASELRAPLLAVNAAEVQSCWVGQTEKKIVETFREATEAEAVLFWDEADALFINRDQADRSFEVRWVNVLLQEIERFEGTCILATNRKDSLDPALSRRLTVKVEFAKPDLEACRAILRKLIPKALPLARDVDLDAIAAGGLTGGQLKNVVLNAARRALVRGVGSRVTMEDFCLAARAERPVSPRRPIGIR